MKRAKFILPLIPALLLVNYLAFIDEGYRDFRWAQEPSNWVAFFVYLAIFYVVFMGLMAAAVKSVSLFTTKR